MRPFRLAVLAAVTLVGLLLAVGGIAYASDYAIEATVQERCSPLNGYSVPIETKMFGIRYTVTGIPVHQCSLVGPGNFVQYHVRTQRTSLWASEGGACIYDSVHGVGGCNA